MANQTLFTQLKLRGGYGETGNQQGLSPQQSLSLVGQGNPSLTYFGGAVVNNYGQIQNANPDLKWETKKQTNIGLDFSLLDSRLRGSIDAYTATTDNLLFNYTVPQPPYPFDKVFANVGSLLNEGIEVALSYDLISNDNTTLTLAGNASFMRNEVLNLSGSINGVPLNTDFVDWGAPNSYLVKGKPVGSFYTLHSTGKDNADAETVLDRDGNGSIDQGSRSADRAYSGSAMPTYTFSFNPTFRYKNLDVSMLWRGSGGNKIYNTLNKSLSYQESIGKSNVLKSSLALGMYTSQYASDLWLEDGDFIRLENVAVGYNFTFKEVKYVESLRLTLTGNNLLLFTDYTGMDPEINLSGGGANFGSDMGIYPRTRTVGLGLSVKFK